MSFTQADRQYLIRTVLGEAANQSPDGQAGVAHVILNRMKKRGAPDVRSIVLAKNQFEPWNDPNARARMLAYREDDPKYQKAAQIVDGVLSGSVPDPTGGADHFLNEKIVRQRRKGSLPRWANEMWDTRQKIGDHTFLGGKPIQTAQAGGNWVEVTDPGILEQLNASGVSEESDGWTEVTDPAILEQLNGNEAPAPAAPAPPETSGANIPDGMVFIPGKDGREGYYLDTKAEAELNAREGGVGNHLMGLAGQAQKGVPFLGEYLDEASGAVDEALGGTPGLVEARVRAANDQFEKDHRYQSIGANLAGGLAVAAPLAVGLAPSVAAKAPVSMVGKVAAGAGVGVTGGAAEGIVSGYGSGETEEERRENAINRGLTGAAMGGFLGAAAPVAAKGAENLIGYIRGKADKATAASLGVSPEATDVVRRMVDNDGGEAAISKIASAGDGAMIADAGPATAGLLDATIQSAGPAGRIARDAITDRSAAAGREIRSSLDQFLGKPRGIKAAGRDIAKGSAAARSRAYEAAYNTPINYASKEGRAVEEVLSRIPARQMQAAITDANEEMVSLGLQNQQIMAKLADDGTVQFVEMPNVRQLDALKQALDRAGSVEDIFGRPKQEAIRPRRLARQLRNAIADAAVSYKDTNELGQKLLSGPGVSPQKGVRTYERALKLGGQKIAEDKALETGRRILQPQFTREDVADALDDATHAELRQARTGLRRQIDEVMVNVKRAIGDANMDAREGVKAMKELSSPAVREKIAVVMGAKDAKKLTARIDRASKAFELAARTADNSKTFARGEFKNMVSDITEPGAIGKLLEGSPVQSSRAIVQAMTKMDPKTRQATEERIAGEIATLLTTKRGRNAEEAVRKMVALLERGPATKALAKSISQKVGALTVSGGYTAGSALAN